MRNRSQRRNYKAKFLESLEHLSELKKGAIITICAWGIEPSRLTQESAKSAAEDLEFCFKKLLQLKDAGYTVYIRLERSEDFGRGRDYDGGCMGAEDEAHLEVGLRNAEA